MSSNLRTSLLDPGDSVQNGDTAVSKRQPAAQPWTAELAFLLRLSAPACIQLCCQQALVLTNQVLVGHIGKDELAAAAIGVTWFNLGFYYLLGVTSALDTLGSQAYGAGDQAAVLSWTVAAIAVCSVLCIPMAVALWFADRVAIALFQQPQNVATMVGIYCRWMIPSLWPYVWAIILMKNMQAQNRMWGPTLATVFVFLANIGISILLIALYGFVGASASTSVSRTLMLLIVCIAMWVKAPKASMSFASWKGAVTRGWSLKTQAQFLSIGMPGGFMMAADASAFDITTAMAGFLGTAELDAHTIMLTTSVFIFLSFPFGVATAATIRVGNLLGGNRPSHARLAGMLCIGLGAAFMAVAGICIYVFRYEIGEAFSDDRDVIAMVARIAPLSAAYQFPDGILGSIGGVLRGLGQQALLMIFNLVGFWGVGVTCGYFFTFVVGWGLPGLWLGIDTGVCITATLCITAMWLVDWEKEAAKAQAKLAEAEAEALGLEGIQEDEETLASTVHDVAQHEPLTSTSRPFARVISIRDHAPIAIRHSEEDSSGELGRSLGRSMSRSLANSFTVGSLTLADPISRAFAPNGRG